MSPKSSAANLDANHGATPEKGVAAAPGGLGAGAWWAVIAALVLVFTLLFWLAAQSFDRSVTRLEQRLALGAGDGDGVDGADDGDSEFEIEEAAASTSDAPSAAAPSSTAAGQRVEEPRQPTWTLLDVEGAVSSLAPQIETLIGEGRTELPEFRALSSSNTTRAARARESWAAWARIWRNRVGRLSAQLPPAAACSVHAAMDPACRALRSILAQLESVADAETLDSARRRLDDTAAALDFFVNPPEPEPEPAEQELVESEE